jgi:hypothetical protein
MNYARGILEMAHDLAAIIDPKGIGRNGAREIDLGEYAVIQEKAMESATGILELADDLAAIIDRVDYSE